MKSVKYILFLIAGSLVMASCEKKDYNRGGLPEYANHYYAAYIPNNNSKVSVQRTQSTLVKFAVQFYSAYVRDYDAVAYYGLSTKGYANAAVLGQDFNIVD